MGKCIHDSKEAVRPRRVPPLPVWNTILHGPRPRSLHTKNLPSDELIAHGLLADLNITDFLLQTQGAIKGEQMATTLRTHHKLGGPRLTASFLDPLAFSKVSDHDREESSALWPGIFLPHRSRLWTAALSRAAVFYIIADPSKFISRAHF